MSDSDIVKPLSSAELFKRDPQAYTRREHDAYINAEENVLCDLMLEDRPFLSYDEKRLSNLPLMYDSIGLTSPDHWSLGSSMICEKIEGEVPSDTVYSWVDDGSTYCLRKRPEPKADRSVEGDPSAGRVQRRTRGGVWILSPNVFCKVEGWVEELTTDADNIRFINQNIPALPTQELMYDWIDREWSRVFMITRRAPGTLFNDAWTSLTLEQKLHTAAEVAKYQKLLSTYTSDYLQTINGGGVEGKYSLRLREDFPIWKPRVEPKVSREMFKEFLIRLYEVEVPDIGEHFVLQHPDLNPRNFFITLPSKPTDLPQITAIIDWTSLGYFPKYNIATEPRARIHFLAEDAEDGQDWLWMLSNAFAKEGFPIETEYLRRLYTKFNMGFCDKNLPN